MWEEMLLIKTICDELDGSGTELMSIKNALEDGEALAGLGVEDDDQSVVEGAHYLVELWLEKGMTLFSDVEDCNEAYCDD